jgi:hypothetical protein
MIVRRKQYRCTLQVGDNDTRSGSVATFYNTAPVLTVELSFHLPTLGLGVTDISLANSSIGLSMLWSMLVGNQISSLSWGNTAGAHYHPGELGGASEEQQHRY